MATSSTKKGANTHGVAKDVQHVEKDVQPVEKDVKPAINFWTKFNNDWSFNLAAALAYNLLLSIFPIALALLSILGIIVGTLSPHAYASLAHSITHGLPSYISGTLGSTLSKQQSQLARNSIILAIVSIILALFNGSRLFVLLEGCFGIIYHVRQRTFIKQNLMALGMLLLFIILIPIMVVAASLPSYITGLLSSIGIGNSPITAILYPIIGIVVALFIAWVLFEAIYIVVPNQKISFKHSWLGSLVGAILLELFLVLFPFYVAHFLTGYAASISSVLILLIFFYYFGVILFFGAEVNAVFAEHITSTPTDIVSMVHIMTSHLPKDPQEKEDQAAISHKPQPLGNVASKTHIDSTMRSNNPDTHEAAIGNGSGQRGKQQRQNRATSRGTRSSSTPNDMRTPSSNLVTEPDTTTRTSKPKKLASSKMGTAFEVAAGTILAFLIEWFRIRRGRTQ
jgi:membrane protein